MQLVYRRHWTFETALEVFVLFVNRQVGLHVAEVFNVLFHLRAFFRVADGNERFKCGFVTKKSIGINLIGPNHHFDRGPFQVHPGDFRGVIIIGEKGIGADVQKMFQAWIAGYFCGFAHQVGGGLKPFAVNFGIRDGDQVFSLAPDHGIKAAKRGLIPGMIGNPVLELLLGHIGGVKSGPGGHWRFAIKCMALFERIPGPEMQIKHIQKGFPVDPLAGGNFSPHRGIIYTDLAQKYFRHQVADHIKPIDNLTLFLGQEGGIGCHVNSGDGGPADHHVISPGGLFNRGGLIGRGWFRTPRQPQSYGHSNRKKTHHTNLLNYRSIRCTGASCWGRHSSRDRRNRKPCRLIGGRARPSRFRCRS